MALRKMLCASHTLPIKTANCPKFRHTRPTDVRIWPASERPAFILLFICGNPGLISYYDEFLSAIHAVSPDTYEVIGIGHEGHSAAHSLSYLEALNRPATFGTQPIPGLQQQIQTKVEYIDELRLQYGRNVKLGIMGHSVGAYICQEIMKQRPEAVDYMYGLFPTIAHIAKSPNGLKLAPIFNPAVITLVTAFLVCLNAIIPSWIIEGLIRGVTGQHRPASRVTTELITTPGAVASALTMAENEMKTIKKLDERFLEEYGDRITLYFAAGDSDGWVGNAQRVKDITTCLDRSKRSTDKRKRCRVCDKGMVHAFCLEHSAVMAKACAEWIAQDLA